jgi:rod shape-determining protein MreB and related proteins
MSMLSRKIGIDLGTATVRIYVKGEGVVVNERADRKRTLHELIGKANGRPRLFRPDVVVSVPSAVTSGERRAVTEAAMSAGARQVWLIDEPLAAAMGAGLPIGELRASAICELGAATTEIAVISRSGTVIEQSLPVGGNDLDRAIASALSIDERAAEAVKIEVGSAVPLQEPLVTAVDGREFSSNAVAEAIQPSLRRIAAAVRDVVAQTPAGLAVDIKERGIVLSGGGAQLRGIDRYISLHAGINARVADEPQTSVVRGTGLALENFEVLKRNQSYIR